MRTLIIDDFFDDPREVRSYGLSLQFNSRVPPQYWEGKRTQNLGEINPEFHNQLSKLFLDSYFGKDTKAQIEGHSHFHYNSYDDMYSEQYRDMATRIHLDDEKYVAMVYLSPNPTSKSGLYLYDSDEPTYIQNKFNRFIMFPSGKVFHSFGEFFGKDKYDSRMTLLYFFDSIDLFD